MSTKLHEELARGRKAALTGSLCTRSVLRALKFIIKEHNLLEVLWVFLRVTSCDFVDKSLDEEDSDE